MISSKLNLLKRNHSKLSSKIVFDKDRFEISRQIILYWCQRSNMKQITKMFILKKEFKNYFFKLTKDFQDIFLKDFLSET